jgi:hypothetical protein
MEETAPALAIPPAAEAAQLEETVSALGTALAKKNSPELSIASVRVEEAATLLIIALAEVDAQASALACTTPAETSVFAITFSMEEPDTPRHNGKGCIRL